MAARSAMFLERDLVRQIFRLHGHESETLFAGIAEHGFEVTEEAE
jgi:hypothetical protein